MRILRLRPAKQRLQQAVDVGRGLQVAAAGHQRDALQRVVMGHAEMVARRDVLARQHDVAEAGGVAGETPLAAFVEAERRGELRQRGGRVEPERMLLAGGDAVGALGGCEPPAGPGIERALGTLRCAGGGGDLGAGAEAGVEQAARG